MRVFLIVFGAVLVAMLGAPLLAQTPPTRVFGSVTVGGRPAPLGTVVQALIGDKVCGEGQVRRVSDEIPVGYVVDVVSATQTPGCGTDGATIVFKVGGVQANERGEFQTGTFLRLNLTVSGQVSTPTPGPTPSPFGSPTAPTGGATVTPPAAGSPTPGQPTSVATATAIVTVEATPAPTTPLPRFTATPADVERGGGDRGVPAVLWAGLAVALAGVVVGGGYFLYRRRR